MSPITVTTRRSWFSRIGSSFTNILLGVVMVLLAFPLLFWNEGRAVKTFKTLQEGAGIVVSVDGVDTVNPDLESKLGHYVGDVDVPNILKDDQFGIGGNFVALDRKVEMFQWVELEESTTKDKIGGGQETVTTYSYEKAWSGNLSDSSGFADANGHTNPTEFRFTSKQLQNDVVDLGVFSLSDALISQIGPFEPLKVTEKSFASGVPNGAYVRDGLLYFGETVGEPEVGDLRITFSVVNPGTVSVVAQQAGTDLIAYQAKTGKSIALLSNGVYTAEQMFAQEQKNNKTLTWIVRAGGIALLYFGLMMIFGVLGVLADVVPLFGTIIRAGLKLVSFIIALILGGLTIAIAWFAFRPLLSVGILVVIVLLVVGLIYLSKKRK